MKWGRTILFFAAFVQSAVYSFQLPESDADLLDLYEHTIEHSNISAHIEYFSDIETNDDWGLPGFIGPKKTEPCLKELWHTPEIYSFSKYLSKYYWSDFNVIALSSVRQMAENELENGVKIGGRVAAGRDLIIKSTGSVGKYTLNPNARRYNALVGRDFVFSKGDLYPREELIFVGGDYEDTPMFIENRIRNTCPSSSKGFCLHYVFSQAYWYYTLLSRFWALHPATGIVEVHQEWRGTTLVISGGQSQRQFKRYYVKLEAQLFMEAKVFALEGIDPSAEIVVTITGAEEITISNQGKFPTITGDFPGRTVFNFPYAKHIIVENARLPSIVAPHATIEQRSGRIQGFAIAWNFDPIKAVHNLDCEAY